MTPTSSLLADRNCLQVQADRSMSSAKAGTHDNSAPATVRPAKSFMAIPPAVKVFRQSRQVQAAEPAVPAEAKFGPNRGAGGRSAADLAVQTRAAALT